MSSTTLDAVQTQVLRDLWIARWGEAPVPYDAVLFASESGFDWCFVRRRLVADRVLKGALHTPSGLWLYRLKPEVST